MELFWILCHSAGKFTPETTIIFILLRTVVLTQKRHRVVTLGEKNASLVLQQNLVAQRLFVLEIVGWGGLELESENKN